jgi:hypothetical protein
LNGQWIGRYNGTNSGHLVIELDDRGTHYEGIACAYDDDNSLPSTFAFIKTTDKQPSFQKRLDLSPIDPRSDQPTEWNKIRDLFPQADAYPSYADVRLEVADDTLNISWTTDIGTTGSSEIKKSSAAALTEYQPLPDVTSWDAYKKYVCDLEYRRFIFRGQAQQLRLRTAFHRTGRANLQWFIDNDIKTLHRHLSQRTTHVFNREIPDENGAFFNLVQHHGYPTPLLDWTFSPFVAAYFAYHCWKNSDARVAIDKKVRIFLFDQKLWSDSFKQLSQLTWCKPHFSIAEFIAIDNERLVPQQSISTITNVDDIEALIRSVEHTHRQQFLKIIDLPVSERPKVMKELSIMGITAGSLFPGLDGACAELRERFFDE